MTRGTTTGWTTLGQAVLAPAADRGTSPLDTTAVDLLAASDAGSERLD